MKPLRQKLSDGVDDDHGSGSDRYLVTYADLITLLLGLFVILYSSSQVDAGKYQELSAALVKVFDKSGGDKILDSNKAEARQPVAIIDAASQQSVEQVQQNLEQSLAKYIDQGQVAVQKRGDKLFVSVQDALLFASGQAEVQVSARAVLDTMVTVLSRSAKRVFVAGHSDSLPIRTFRFESNWHLSVSRALSVGYYLVQRGMPENHVSIAGYAATKPVASNGDEFGRSLNRRVELIISELPLDVPSLEGYIEDPY